MSNQARGYLIISITDCSRRGIPQHWDGNKWTCKKK